MNKYLIGTTLALFAFASAGVAAEQSGVAVGSNAAASDAAAGSVLVPVAAGVGAAAIIGAVVAGSSDNGTSTSTQTTQ